MSKLITYSNICQALEDITKEVNSWDEIKIAGRKMGLEMSCPLILWGGGRRNTEKKQKQHQRKHSLFLIPISLHLHFLNIPPHQKETHLVEHLIGRIMLRGTQM
jgi:hypothetical protein